MKNTLAFAFVTACSVLSQANIIWQGVVDGKGVQVTAPLDGYTVQNKELYINVANKQIGLIRLSGEELTNNGFTAKEMMDLLNQYSNDPKNTLYFNYTSKLFQGQLGALVIWPGKK